MSQPSLSGRRSGFPAGRVVGGVRPGHGRIPYQRLRRDSSPWPAGHDLGRTFRPGSDAKAGIGTRLSDDGLPATVCRMTADDSRQASVRSVPPLSSQTGLGAERPRSLVERRSGRSFVVAPGIASRDQGSGVAVIGRGSSIATAVGPTGTAPPRRGATQFGSDHPCRLALIDQSYRETTRTLRVSIRAMARPTTKYPRAISPHWKPSRIKARAASMM